MNVCWVGVTLLLLLACGWTDRVYAGEYQGDFLPQWAVEIHGGEVQARSVAETHGYTLLHPVSISLIIWIHLKVCLSVCMYVRLYNISGYICCKPMATPCFILRV